eukprot:c22038_g1_i2 orf=612-1634(-)
MEARLCCGGGSASASHHHPQLVCPSPSSAHIAASQLPSSLSCCRGLPRRRSCLKVVIRSRYIMACVIAPALSNFAAKSIGQTFSELRKRGKVALIPYITAGDPDLSTSAEALKTLDCCGADIIELGVPYSDPLADGPVIQAAATRALQNGTNLESVLEMLSGVSPNLKAPVVLFTYYNPILRRGVENFLQAIKAAGVAGLVIPDIPLEETKRLQKLTFNNNIELVLLVTPTTPKERMNKIAEASQGFVYLVSVTGVTGARASVEGRVESLLQGLKKVTEKPVAVGFGISKPEHALQIARWGADGVIIGSAIVKLLGEASSPEECLGALRRFIKDMKAILP